MNYNEYKEQIFNDTIEYIKDNEYLANFKNADPNYRWEEREFYEIMEDAELPVTGNDNGSYYCSSYKAKEALRDAVFDTDILSVLSANCMEDMFWRYMQDGDYESADVIIRCAMFYEISYDVEAWIEEQIGRELD